MKNSTKIILITSAGLIVVGMILAICGYVAGGSTRVYYRDGRFWPENYNTQTFEEQKTLSPFQSVLVRADSVNEITFVASDHYALEYRVTTDKDLKPQVNVQNGVLNFIEGAKNGSQVISIGLNGIGIFNDNGFEQNYLTIYYPAQTEFADVSVTTGFGSVHINGLSAQTLDVNSDFGKVDLKQIIAKNMSVDQSNGAFTGETLVADRLEITNDFGSVRLDNIQVHGPEGIILSLSNGKLKADTLNAPKISYKNDFGSTEFYNVSIEQGRMNLSNGSMKAENCMLDNITIENDFGSVRLNGNNSKNLTVVSSNGDIEIEGALSGNISLTSEFGSLRVTTPGQKNDYNWEMSTDFGSISIYEGGEKINAKNDESSTQNNNAANNLNIHSDNGSVKVYFGD